MDLSDDINGLLSDLDALINKTMEDVENTLFSDHVFECVDSNMCE